RPRHVDGAEPRRAADARAPFRAFREHVNARAAPAHRVTDASSPLAMTCSYRTRAASTIARGLATLNVGGSMRKTIIGSLCASILFTLACVGTARARVDVHLSIPAPPIITFHHEPEVVVVPRTHVSYYADPDYDMYHYGSSWYVNRNGYWYRSPAYGG